MVSVCGITAVNDLQRFLCLLPLPCLYLRNVNLWKILLPHLVNELVSAQHCLLPHLCLVHNMKLIAFLKGMLEVALMVNLAYDQRFLRSF